MVEILDKIETSQNGLVGITQNGNSVALGTPEPNSTWLMNSEETNMIIKRVRYRGEKDGFDFVYFGQNFNIEGLSSSHRVDMTIPYISFHKRK